MRRVHAVPLGGMEVLCRVVVGCAQPEGWKNTVPTKLDVGSLSVGGSFWSGVVCLH